MFIILWGRGLFQLEWLFAVSTSLQLLLQPHDRGVVAAAVRPPVLHALVSSFGPDFRRIFKIKAESAFSPFITVTYWPEPSSTPPHQPDPLSRRPPAGHRGNPEVQMNAQGGEILNEEELNRDWLDWVYTFSRAAILLSIVYFYSSFSRFVMVMMAMLVLYL